MSLLHDLEDGQKREITREQYIHNREVLPPVAHDFTFNGEPWDFGFAEGYDYVIAFRHQGDQFFAQKTPFVNPKECGRSIDEQQVRLEPPIPGQLSEPALAALLSRLSDHGHSREAEALRSHILALENRITAVSQYYEEYVIPLRDGRPIEKAGGTWAQREQEQAKPERTP